MTKTGEIKIIVEGKEPIRFIVEAVEGVVGNRDCRFCKSKIYEDNFGKVNKLGFVCSNLICLIKDKEHLKKL